MITILSSTRNCRSCIDLHWKKLKETKIIAIIYSYRIKKYFHVSLWFQFCGNLSSGRAIWRKKFAAICRAITSQSPWCPTVEIFHSPLWLCRRDFSLINITGGAYNHKFLFNLSCLLWTLNHTSSGDSELLLWTSSSGDSGSYIWNSGFDIFWQGIL